MQITWKKYIERCSKSVHALCFSLHTSCRPHMGVGGLMLPAFMSPLQTYLCCRGGLPTGLMPEGSICELALFSLKICLQVHLLPPVARNRNTIIQVNRTCCISCCENAEAIRWMSCCIRYVSSSQAEKNCEPLSHLESKLHLYTWRPGWCTYLYGQSSSIFSSCYAPILWSPHLSPEFTRWLRTSWTLLPG